MSGIELSKREVRIRNLVWAGLVLGSSLVSAAIIYGGYWVFVGAVTVLNAWLP